MVNEPEVYIGCRGMASRPEPAARGSGDQAPNCINYMTAWASNYGILLGPIAGIMIAKHWIVRKQTVDLQALYTKPAKGLWSLSGFLALLGTWVLCCITATLINQMACINIRSLKVPFPGGVIWYFSVVYAILLEWLFATVIKEPKAA